MQPTTLQSIEMQSAGLVFLLLMAFFSMRLSIAERRSHLRKSERTDDDLATR